LAIAALSYREVQLIWTFSAYYQKSRYY